MKKTIIFSLLISSSLILTGCTPAVIQGATTASAVITANNDRRSAGEVLDDRTIAFKLFAWSEKDPKVADAHINFMIYNRTVLATGEAPNNNVRSYVVNQAKLEDAKITQVFNEITIGPNSGLLSRAKDSTITLQVETLFYDQEAFHPTQVRVMTENQTVYLMGAVTKREADIATKTAAKAKGVKKVVKLFDYLKTRPAAEIERDRQREIAAQKAADLKKQQAELDAQKAELKRQLKELGGTTGTSGALY